MTATTDKGIELRLPFTWWRNNRHTPTTARDFAGWAIEELVTQYGHTDEPVLLEIAYWSWCRHLCWSEFSERIELLCAISADCADWEDKPGHEDRETFQAFQDDYRAALAALVTPPSDRIDALVDAVSGPHLRAVPERAR